MLRRLNLSLIVALVGLSFSPAYGSLCRQVIYGEYIRHIDVQEPSQVSHSQIHHYFEKPLRIASYNVENFFTRAGVLRADESGRFQKLSGFDEAHAKDPRDAVYLAKIIEEDLKADIVALQEIEKVSALHEFSETHLHDRYVEGSLPGNDLRGIGLGFLFQRKLPVHVEMRSYRDRMWNDPVYEVRDPVFSRDAEVSLFTAHEAKRPFLAIINIHSKSKRDRGRDKQSFEVRDAQHQEVVRIYRELQEEFGKDIPVAIVGDMNTEVGQAKELKHFTQAGFVEALELANLPPESRVTHVYFPKSGEAVSQQLDALYLSPSLQPYLIKAGVHPYRFNFGEGILMPPPTSREQRSHQPSDHQAIYMDLNLKSLVQKSYRSKDAPKSR